MDNEEIQQLQNLNFLAEQNNAKVVSSSSELQNAQATNILSSNRKNIWMSEEGMPQHIIIDISKLAERPKFFKCVAFDCWHDYKTNPSIIEFLVSTDNKKEYITWSTIYLELKEGLQVFQIDPLGRRYDFIKIVIKETYGGAKTYLNQILLFEENPFGNKQPGQQQHPLQSNSLALLLRNKSNAQDLSMNIDSEMDEKSYNVARLNIPKPFPHSSGNNTMSTQSNNMITQTNQTLPDQNMPNNMIQQLHPANLPSINYPMHNNSDRRMKHNSVNSIKKRSLVSSPSEELLNYQGNIHQSGNNTQQMNGQFFHTPSHSNHNIMSNHHLQSNQGIQPLDSIQKQLYQIQQQSIPGSSTLQSVRGLNSYQQQPQINTNDLDQIQQNLNLKLQNMNKEIMQLDHPNEVIMDNSRLTPVHQDNYAELQKHLFGQPNIVQQHPQQRELTNLQNSNNNLFDKVNTSGFKLMNQHDQGQLVSSKTSQISQVNNQQQHNTSQNSNLNVNNQFEDNPIPPHLLTQSEKEVIALRKMVQQLKEENTQKDILMKKLEQTVLNLQYTCQNLVEKVDSLENKFENFKLQSRNIPSYRRTTQTDDRDEDVNNHNYVLETNQKQHFPLNSPQTFGKNFSHPVQNNNQNSGYQYDDYNSNNIHTDQDKIYDSLDPKNEKINKLIEQKLDQFQKVVVNTLKKNMTPYEQDQEHQNMQPVRSSQSIQSRAKQQMISQSDNYDNNNKKTNKSRQNSSNSRTPKTQEYYQPPSFSSNSRNEFQGNQKPSYHNQSNQSGLDQYPNRNMGNRSNSNHSQQNAKSYRSTSKQNQEYNDRQQVPLSQVQSNKQFNTEPNRNRTESQQNPRVVKLLEKLQEKLTIRQMKVEQLNSGKKNKKDYYDRDFDEISDIQEGARQIIFYHIS